MKPSTSYKKLHVWDKSRVLVGLVYEHTGNLHDYGYRDQIRRAAVSVMNNIAEGAERGSKRILRV